MCAPLGALQGLVFARSVHLHVKPIRDIHVSIHSVTFDYPLTPLGTFTGSSLSRDICLHIKPIRDIYVFIPFGTLGYTLTPFRTCMCYPFRDTWLHINPFGTFTCSPLSGHLLTHYPIRDIYVFRLPGLLVTG